MDSVFANSPIKRPQNHFYATFAGKIPNKGTTSLAVPGFAYDKQADYTRILRDYNHKNTQELLKK